MGIHPSYGSNEQFKKLEKEVDALQAKTWTRKLVSPKGDGLFVQDLYMYFPPTAITDTQITNAFNQSLKDQTPENDDETTNVLKHISKYNSYIFTDGSAVTGTPHSSGTFRVVSGYNDIAPTDPSYNFQRGVGGVSTMGYVTFNDGDVFELSGNYTINNIFNVMIK